MYEKRSFANELRLWLMIESEKPRVIKQSEPTNDSQSEHNSQSKNNLQSEHNSLTPLTVGQVPLATSLRMRTQKKLGIVREGCG